MIIGYFTLGSSKSLNWTAHLHDNGAFSPLEATVSIGSPQTCDIHILVHLDGGKIYVYMNIFKSNDNLKDVILRGEILRRDKKQSSVTIMQILGFDHVIVVTMFWLIFK